MSGITLLVSDFHGVFVPKQFVEKFDLTLWNGIDPADIETLKEGPDADWYWESWSNVLDSASYKHDGHTWRLSQDGDLWAYCIELMTDEEYENFFGERRFDFDSDSRWETDNWYDTSAELN